MLVNLFELGISAIKRNQNLLPDTGVVKNGSKKEKTHTDKFYSLLSGKVGS